MLTSAPERRYVILSAPSKSDDVETIVHGVNTPQGGTAIISCASCTTNCITPVMEILGRRIGVKKAIMTTVHGYTASQAIVDAPHTHARRGRAGAANLVPTSTGAAAATTRALPEYRGRFDGVAVRAPVPVGSLADIVTLTARPTTVDEVNRVFTEEAESERYRGVLGVTTDPVVSSDIIKDPRASVVDLGMTQVVDGDLIKVMSWYDNEWGYSSQLVREALADREGDGSSDCHECAVIHVGQRLQLPRSSCCGQTQETRRLGDSKMTTRRLGREQGTGQDVAHRASLPGWVPRPMKRASGRTETSQTPAHVRVIGVELEDDDHALIRRKLGMKLGKFATSNRARERTRDGYEWAARWSRPGVQREGGPQWPPERGG